jgi:hypothetical protein
MSIIKLPLNQGEVEYNPACMWYIVNNKSIYTPKMLKLSELEDGQRATQT